MVGGEQPLDSAPAEFRIATYREIADRFGLGSPDAARVRAKRAKWEREPTNHPLDPVRVRVPLTEWEQAADRTPDRPRSSRQDRSLSPSSNGGINSTTVPPNIASGSAPSQLFADALSVVQDQLESERERVAVAEARAQAAESELRGVRELLARREGELDGIKLATEHLHDELARARQEAADAHNRVLEATARADNEKREREGTEQTLTQLRGRGLVARVLNRR